MSNANAYDPSPSPFERDDLDERGSTRSLDEIGVGAVLGAMIEQRKRSSRPAACEVSDAESTGQLASVTDDQIVSVTPMFEDTPRAQRVPAHSDAFLKVR